MPIIAISLIILSGFFHATYNLLIKRSLYKQIFLAVIFIMAAIILGIGIALLSSLELFMSNLRAIPYAFFASSMYALYQLFTSKAYEMGDISLVYPLTMLSPLFIPIWAYVTLGEKISLIGFLGILFLSFGAYIIQLKSLILKDVLHPIFSVLRDRAVQLALLAALFYSIGVTFDKAGLEGADVFIYVWFIISFMAAWFLLYSIISKRFQLLAELKKSWKWMVLGGVVVAASFLTFRFALKVSLVSYAVPIRQSSVLFGVFYGIILLKEEFGKIRFIASIIIISGIWLLSVA